VLLVHPRVIASHHWRPTTLQVLSTTTALSHSMDGLKGPQPASSPRRARRPCTTPKVARPHFPKQACIVIKHCRCLLRQHLRSCLVRFCVGGVRRVFRLLSTSCRLSSGHSPAALALHGAPPFRRPGTQFWRQACCKPSNLRPPRPKTATTEPACASSPASSGMPTQPPLANQPPPPACLSRSQETSENQPSFTVSATFPWPRSAVAITHVDSRQKAAQGGGLSRSASQAF